MVTQRVVSIASADSGEKVVDEIYSPKCGRCNEVLVIDKAKTPVQCQDCDQLFHRKCCDCDLSRNKDIIYWICNACTQKKNTLKVFDIMTRSGTPGSSPEQTELEARLSVFDHYMFLLEKDSPAASSTPQISLSFPVDDCVDRGKEISSPRYVQQPKFAATSTSDVMHSGPVGNERENADLQKRLSAFDEYIFLVD
uniref:PHD-type domain-containing protein n=1 Tax=Odontella aurita TaxID=265563 RepID=A0A7S4JUD6_9STRA|mmetsp:Transcript_53744/g.160894  ORF Transcript_53744/g.160894 Transcript_53744/m.160894 type:complete len:196 (+) Transcript_53744:216-803(+)